MPRPSPIPPTATSKPAAAPRRQLSLWDATLIIVGIIIGSGLYKSSPDVARQVPDLVSLVGMWIAGGLIALVGALCYAELAAAFPHEGGDYVYLTKAFGRGMGFVFAWAELWIIRPANMGALSFVFAQYFDQLLPLEDRLGLPDSRYAIVIYACAAVLILTVINILGVREGKWTQNLLTIVKVVGLVAVFGVAFAGPPAAHVAATAMSPSADYRMAFIFVMFTYGGWSDVAFVAAEVRDAHKNILRSLLLGISCVALIYILANLAFAYVLGFDGFAQSEAVATEALVARLGSGAGRAISLLICISALGSINGQIFTGARVFYAMGTEHPLYARLGRWSPRFGTPVWSLVAQAVVTLVPIVGFGFQKNPFHDLVIFSTPIFWFFFSLVGVALFLLRNSHGDLPRPYKVWGYPLTPLLFCGSSLFMLWSSLIYAFMEKKPAALWFIGIMAIGYALSFYDPRPTKRKARRRRRSR